MPKTEAERLKEYEAKRSFESTPEPVSGEPWGDRLVFVIQKHDASHLHYDFRLENAGVLVSWAIPKGPSMDPGVKRLAMMTEDHPYDYQYFEGVIPKGNYGAGQVIVWDRGTYEVAGTEEKYKEDQEKAFRHGLHEGKVSVILHGEKVKGEFTLVKAPGKSRENAWLLIKKDDEYAGKVDLTEQDRSVITGRRVDEVEEGEVFNWNEWQDCIDKYELLKRDIKRPVSPMLATLVDQPFSDTDWLYELKWDGYRAVAEISGGKVKLYSRRQESFADKYKDVVESLKNIKNDVVIDGEIVALDEKGHPDFNALQNHGSLGGTLAYYVFDLLWLDGYDLTHAPLIQRKKFLNKVLPASGVLRFSDHVLKEGEKLFKLASSEGLEGVIAKKADSTYMTGKRSRSWLKFKTGKRQEAVIGGFTEPRGGRKGLGALVLGVHKAGKLVYIGHSGSGLGDRQLIDLRKRLEKIEIKSSPFETPPKPNAPVHWVKPELLVEVGFTEWTPTGHMRHPRIIGLRTDKPAQNVVREEPIKKSEVLDDKKTGFEPKNFQFSHMDKIFWPGPNISKGDLVDYYHSVASRMMPYLKDRPMTLLRHPNGIHGNSFFQKDMTQPLPEGFRTFRRYSESNKKDVNYLVCDGENTLLYMVQLGCIEINPWNSTIINPDKPDWLVLDLDPEDIDFKQVVKVALTIKKILDGLDLPAFIKTTGKRGMHIYLPLHARYSYEQTKQFAELLARRTLKELPEITSLERSPSKRQGKVYIDYLQNRIGQTLAAPFSARPTPEATISTPLDWSEVDEKLSPKDFNLDNISDLLKRPDPWKDFFETHVDIRKALDEF